MENIEKIKSRAKKLKALADGGDSGEKDTAIEMYKDFIKKHNLDESEIDPSKNSRTFKVKSEDDSLILNNVILSVNPYTKIVSHQLFVKCDLDLEDFKEVKEKFRYFIKLYRIERELLNMAFFSKHAVFFAPDDNAKNKWRENRNENEELKKAKEKAEKINDSKESGKAKVNEIQLLNLSRLGSLTEILLEGKYVRNNQTIEEEKKC